MRQILRLIRDKRGASMIELALTLPILMTALYGIFVVGCMLEANAGIQHALGEGARAATLFPTPSDPTLVTRMQNRVFGMNYGVFNTPTVTTPLSSSCTNCRDLSVSYTLTPNFLFFNGPPITLTRTKRVYLAT